MADLTRGDLPPEIVVPPPGPRSRGLCARLAGCEAPGANTLAGGEPSIVWAEALGANVLDVDGNRYVDLAAGFGAALIGHRHPRVVRAVERQSRELLHGLGDVAAHPARVELAERLAALAPFPDAHVHFAVSGADAVEIALGTALLATGRSVVIAFEPAYHGTTLGALAVTSRPAFREPFRRWLNPHVERFDYGAPLEPLGERLGRGDVAAVIVEPIAGREGVIVPPAGWLAELAGLARRHGALLITDEIFTGCGRTGRFWAVEDEGVTPDLLCCGKALGGGLPIAAVLGRAELMNAWDPGPEGEALHTATHLAQPLSCAAALAVLDAIEEEGLVARAARLGERLTDDLGAWPERVDGITAIRGRGAIWGVDLASREEAYRVATAAAARGVLLLAGGAEGRVAQIAPPLAITDEQLDVALDLVADALRERGH